METSVNTTGIKKVRSAVSVDEVKAHLYKTTMAQAQLRQVITTTYPSAKAGNSLSGSLFGAEEFGFAEGQSFDENRVAWIDVPLNATKEMVEARLAALPEACLQKHLASKPILSAEQQSSIETGINSKTGFVTGDEIYDKIERSQRVRNREEELIDRDGEVIFEDSEGNVAEHDQHRVQYKIIVFQPTYVADVDNRVKLVERIQVTTPETAPATTAPVVKATASQF